MSTTPRYGDPDNTLLFKIALSLSEGQGGSGVAGVGSFNGRTGIVTLQEADVSAVADARYVNVTGDSMTGGLNITPAVNTKALFVNNYSLTGVSAEPMLLLSGTWNTTSEATAISLNITDTNSHANSRVLDLSVDDNSVFYVTKNGDVSWDGLATGDFDALTANSVSVNNDVQVLGSVNAAVNVSGNNISGGTVSGTTLEAIDLNVSGLTQLGTGGLTFRVDGAGQIGFFGATVAPQQTSALLVNNVTAGGTNDTIDDYSDLTVYATDAPTIRDNIYQLARKLKEVTDAMNLYGLLTPP